MIGQQTERRGLTRAVAAGAMFENNRRDVFVERQRAHRASSVVPQRVALPRPEPRCRPDNDSADNGAQQYNSCQIGFRPAWLDSNFSHHPARGVDLLALSE